MYYLSSNVLLDFFFEDIFNFQWENSVINYLI